MQPAKVLPALRRTGARALPLSFSLLVLPVSWQIGGFTPSQVAPSTPSDPIEDSPAAPPGAQASDTLPGPSAPSLAPTASAADGPLQSGSASVASVADADPGWGAGAPSDPQMTPWPSNAASHAARHPHDENNPSRLGSTPRLLMVSCLMP